jgi:hypothetical protein
MLGATGVERDPAENVVAKRQLANGQQVGCNGHVHLVVQRRIAAIVR